MSARAVAVEITDCANLPTRARKRPDLDGRGPLTVRQFPDVGLTGAGIEPQHIIRAVAVEVAGAGYLPAAPAVAPKSMLPAHAPLDIFHSATSPVLGLYQRMSLVPLPLKSPMPAT